ncbi:MAG: CidA/LrgA family protein [Pseudoalteromonas sp.]|uniref:CidA/LrgA family protein n=1 Tax=unclassified Pseudoalteromonas TaxID=194690 RepID=UPI003F9A1CE7
MLKYILSSIIILSCLALAKIIMHFIGGNFPAPILAMLFLLALLLIGIIKEHQVAPCASPLLNFMPLFFIPAGVGFIEHLDIINAHWSFLISVVILVPLTSVLLVASIISRFKGKHNE